MNTFTTRRRVPFTARQMYDLVADMERYPQFLPLIEDLRVLRRDVVDGRVVVTADMTAGYKAIRETFRTRVTLDASPMHVDVAYISGPFSFLDNRWRFHPVPGGCEVEFFIAYDFKSRLLGMLVGAVFDRAFRRFAEAFEERARHIYANGAARTAAAARPAVGEA